MSNYPPTPSFGGPFNYSGQYPAPPPPPHGSHNMMNYPPYQQPRDGMYGRQPSHMAPSVPYNNAYAFNANAQTSNVNVHGNGAYHPPPSSFHTYGPPSYPPVSVPNYNVTHQHFATPVSQALNPTTLQPHTSLPPKPPTAIAHTVPLNQGNTVVAAGTTADREDGEVSDGDLKNAGAIKSTGSSSRPSPEKIRDARKRSTSGLRENLGRKSQSREGSIKSLVMETSSGNISRVHSSSQQPISTSTIQNQAAPIQMSEGNQLLSRRISQSTMVNHRTVGIHSVSNAYSPVPSPTSHHSPTYPNISNGSVTVKPVPNSLSNKNSRSSPVRKHQGDGSLVNGETIRDRAKIAVKQLYDRNIAFDQIVAENIDATFLKDLCSEIGLAVPNSPDRQLIETPIVTTPVVSTQRALLLDNSEMSTSNPTLPTTQPPIFSSQIGEQTMLDSKDSAAGTNMSRLLTAKSDDLPDLSIQPSAAKVNATKGASTLPQVSTSSIPKKSSLVPSGDKIDRKEYIAKMLAAKTGKSITATKTAKPVENPITQAKVEELLPAGNGNTGKTAISVQLPTTAPIDKDLELENKRKAQTELARRRIDALNNRLVTPPKPSKELTPVDSRSVVSNISPIIQSRDQEPSSTRGLPTPLQLQPLPSVTTNSTSQSQFTPSSSFFSSLGWRPPSGLPGLFPFSGLFPPPSDMKEPDKESTTVETGQALSPSEVPPQEVDTIQPELRKESSSEEGMILDPVDSPILSDHSDANDSISQENQRNAEDFLDPQNEQDINFVEESLECAAPATQLQNELENQYKSDEAIRKRTDALSFTPSSPQSSTPSREQTRKRPTASDFIENNAVRIKRRMGSNNQVLIELSEEDDTDDDKMDVDDTPTSVNRVSIPLQHPENVKTKAIQDLPPLSDFSSRAKGGISSAMNTPPSAQTPAKALEKERLKQKEEQILLMQRKIAEMEQRQRAKQSISRAQTPAHNGTPIPEPIPATPESKVDHMPGIDPSVKTIAENVQTQSDAHDLIEQQLEVRQAIAVAGEEEMGENIESEGHAKSISTENSEKEAARTEEAQFVRTAEIQIRMERKIALQNVLLELDEQMERTRKKLEQLNKEIVEIEAELQQRVESRRSIIEELESIIKSEAEDLSETVQTISEPTGASTEINQTTLPVEPNGVPSVHSETSTSLPSPMHHNGIHTASPPQISPQQTQLTRHESMGDVMDISSSSSDEGEVTDSSHRISPSRQITQGDIVAQHDLKSSALVDLQEPITESSTKNHEEDSDYEPPEPDSPVDNQTAPVESAMPNSNLSAPLNSSTIDQSGQSSRGSIAEVSSKPNNDNPSRFTPYESPLNIFTSFRYHPNHKINPQEPLCRWELAGGICNDASCNSQHFRDMVMSDSNILGDLGSRHEGNTPEEKNSYTYGLWELVQEMRSKKIKDLNAIASEISAYRARFLGDDSRVLFL